MIIKHSLYLYQYFFYVKSYYNSFIILIKKKMFFRTFLFTQWSVLLLFSKARENIEKMYCDISKKFGSICMRYIYILYVNIVCTRILYCLNKKRTGFIFGQKKIEIIKINIYIYTYIKDLWKSISSFTNLLQNMVF